MKKHIIVIDLVGAVPKHFGERQMFPRLSSIFAGNVGGMRTIFPAVTCPAQISLITGTPPSEHGIIANGLFDRQRRTATMWTWPASRIERPAIWETLRKRDAGFKTAVFFFQGLKDTTADISINPHPKHTPDGKIIPWCDSRPDGLYAKCVERLGHFPLHKYWGPMADIDSSTWILSAAGQAIAEHRPDLSMVYVPHLDYVGQRKGPESPEFAAEAARIDTLVAQFIADMRSTLQPDHVTFLLVSEYAFRPVSRAALPNVALRQAGLLAVKEENGQELLDLQASAAFALVDHQVAHVFVPPEKIAAAADVLGQLDGVAEVCRGDRLRELGCNHSNCGDLVLLAQPDAWFQYYWWLEAAKAPAFARTVDIHRKPGYDAVELFMDGRPFQVPLDPTLIRGSHGLPPDADNDVLFACSDPSGQIVKPMDITQVNALLLQMLSKA